MKHRSPALLFPFLLLAGCGGETENACGADTIVASDPWVREAGPGHPMSAAYLSLCNGSETADRLVSVSFSGADAAEIHTTTVDENNVARMRPLENGLTLPVGEAAVLAPGSTHIMLMGLTEEITSDSEPTITLNFQKAEPLTLTFEVRSKKDAGHSAH
ncbi:copper chaperone PCu(A)C [Hyphococcus formosus]|uniref:copper chaperone PCu(A)C n=1 Tax=Hyphococcus formosus TaxID=3143534 RepID=UPI00398B3655